MRWRILTAGLVAILLLSTATTVTFAAAPVGPRTTPQGSAAGHVPADVRMDRDFADIPKTQLASPIAVVLSRVAIAAVTSERLIATFFAPAKSSAIIEQQHVFRI